jgi:hypothetical protein
MIESKRIRKLKNRLIQELPFFPNDKQTLNELEGQSLNDVLIHYLHWKTRLVPSRQRKTQLSSDVTSDKRWKSLKNDINSLFDKVRNGDDLFPHLSRKAHKNGYTPIPRKRDGKIDRWEDKDQILNTMGFHHFHLSMNIQSSGLSVRTDDVLFAHVTRDRFHAIGIFDHSVFDLIDETGNMNPERVRMWKLYEKHMSSDMEPGAVYMFNPIMTSGHPMYLIRMCDYYAGLIREFDLKIDDMNYVNDLYEQGKLKFPDKFSFEWYFDGLDLNLIDKKNNVVFNLHKGYI